MPNTLLQHPGLPVTHTQVTSPASKSKIGLYVIAQFLCFRLAACF